MSRKKKKAENDFVSSTSVKLLPISIILFLVVLGGAIGIVLNKGKILGYSLVKIQSTVSQKNAETEEEAKSNMELSIDSKYLSVKSKETEPITVKINGVEQTDMTGIEFESSDESILTVDSKGIVKAISVGKATVTATKDDMTASIDFRTIIPIKSISFTSTNSTVRVGKSLQMKLLATPSDANIETLKYTSSDEKIATVNANGIVTGVAAGKVKITVTDVYTNLEKSLTLTIRK